MWSKARHRELLGKVCGGPGKEIELRDKIIIPLFRICIHTLTTTSWRGGLSELPHPLTLGLAISLPLTRDSSMSLNVLMHSSGPLNSGDLPWGERASVASLAEAPTWGSSSRPAPTMQPVAQSPDSGVSLAQRKLVRIKNCCSEAAVEF